MTPTEFIKKWRAANLKERSAAQEHFLDLCRVLGEPTPAEVDPEGAWYCFERGASKLTGGNGWADVWKRGHFGWEYKSRHKDLQAAYVQLQQYAVALENPPLLVVCDLERFRIHTNWTNTVQQVYDLTLDDLYDPEKLQILKWVFSDPERLKPGKTRQLLTEEAAQQFASLAQRLRARGYESHVVAHFINRLVFCMFAEDVGLLPNQMFRRMLEHAVGSPAEFMDMAQDLFKAMQSGGRVGFEHVEWFNGGLFDTHDALPLEQAEVELVLKAARLDWSDIDPSIFGTLFERGLDPDKRSQLGAHYTDRDKIMMLIEPVIIRPLQAEWEAVKTQIAQQMETFHTVTAARTRNRAWDAAQALHNTFLDRLRHVRVLDPACGSGNFLYLALLALKDLEHRTNLDVEVLGLERQFPSVGPECVKGLEINPYAADLARITVWIGEIQWMRRNGFDVARKPILRPLDTIECRDAVLTPEGSEATWPDADFIVGNPPFLGNKDMVKNNFPDCLTRGILATKEVSDQGRRHGMALPLHSRILMKSGTCF
jgi:type II restriction/modification system DNA methylase subunit YeeA